MRADRPSATAHLIARSLVFLSSEQPYAALIPPGAAELSIWCMEACSSHTVRLLRWMRRRRFREMLWNSERAGLPGMMLHYAVRKLWLEDVTRTALADGYRQVVVLGAGFDTLAPRLAREFPEVRFFEVDHPGTQVVKERALLAHDGLPGNLSLVALDLTRESLGDGIRRAPEFSPAASTLFIAEGLLMYLVEAEVAQLFQCCRLHGGPTPRVAFTFMERASDGRVSFRGQKRLVDVWLRLRGEPFRWGLEQEAMPAFLKAQGFTCAAVATPDVLRARYLSGPEWEGIPLADGDHPCLAV